MSTVDLYTRYLEIRQNDTNIQGSTSVFGNSLLPIVQHLALENGLSEDEVKLQITSGFAENTGATTEEMLRTIEELIALRIEAHRHAMDWKAANGAERAAIQREREWLPG